MATSDHDVTPSTDAPEPAIDRGRFGAAERRRHRSSEGNRAPISSAELSKGPTELAEDRGARVNWRVFIISAVVIVAFSLWAMLAPTNAATTMRGLVDVMVTNLGWVYVVTVVVVILFVLWVAFSKEVQVRLGPDHSRPQYKLFTWVAMLFGAGVGIDMLRLPGDGRRLPRHGLVLEGAAHGAGRTRGPGHPAPLGRRPRRPGAREAEADRVWSPEANRVVHTEGRRAPAAMPGAVRLYP